MTGFNPRRGRIPGAAGSDRAASWSGASFNPRRGRIPGAACLALRRYDNEQRFNPRRGRIPGAATEDPHPIVDGGFNPRRGRIPGAAGCGAYSSGWLVSVSTLAGDESPALLAAQPSRFWTIPFQPSPGTNPRRCDRHALLIAGFKVVSTLAGDESELPPLDRTLHDRYR